MSYDSGKIDYCVQEVHMPNTMADVVVRWEAVVEFPVSGFYLVAVEVVEM